MLMSGRKLYIIVPIHCKIGRKQSSSSFMINIFLTDSIRGQIHAGFCNWGGGGGLCQRGGGLDVC